MPPRVIWRIFEQVRFHQGRKKSQLCPLSSGSILRHVELTSGDKPSAGNKWRNSSSSPSHDGCLGDGAVDALHEEI